MPETQKIILDNDPADFADKKPFSPAWLNRFEEARQKNRPLGVLLYSIDKFYTFQRLYGNDAASYTTKILEDSLKTQMSSYFSNNGYFNTGKLDAGDFLTVLSMDDLNLKVLADMGMTILIAVRRTMNAELVKMTGQKLAVKVGHAIIHLNGGIDFSHSLYRSFCEAKRVASTGLDMSKLEMMEEFLDILETPKLKTVYQPIVDLRGAKPLGWEALTRGPGKSRFEKPTTLFDFAEEVDYLFSLERVCREQAIRQLGKISKDQKLFLNIHPHTVADPSFAAGRTIQIIEEQGLKPDNVVFEITERHPLKDFTFFFKTVEHYRAQGYLVAIDDVGAGYSGLWTIANLRPDFIKLDMSLVRNVDSNPIHRALIETLLTLADKIACKVIAEGIETETELTTLMDMGVPYGQGFYLARPANPKQYSSTRLSLPPSYYSETRIKIACSIPIKELVVAPPTVSPDIPVTQVHDMLESVQDNPISSIVVVNNKKPIGLVMSHHLHRILGNRFGVALYYERPVRGVMDSAPLIFDEKTPVEIAAEMAVNREKHKVYDHVIVTKNGGLTGTVSVQTMMNTLARVQLEMAKGANPLTGLPGNVSIEKEIERRIAIGLPVSFIYADLDNFKIYNDKYGFDSGDNILLLVSKLLSWAVRRHGSQDDFIGHVGGDDFVMITEIEPAERLCKSICRCFGRLAPQYYSREDREKGFIEGISRTGDKHRFPLMTISIAIVDCHGGSDIIQVGQLSADMKKYAKTKTGNSYVRNRRGGGSLKTDD